MADPANETRARRDVSRGALCAAGALMALSALACSGTSNAPTQSAGEQVTAPAASAGTRATTPAAESGGRVAPPTTSVATTSAGTSAAPSSAGAAAPSGGAGAPALTPSAAGAAASAGAPAAMAAGAGGAPDMASGAFILTPIDFPMYEDELTFPQTANPPMNQSPEFTWTGVPADARSLALAFRDLGNSAVKWIIWDMPTSLMHIPPNIEPVAMPSEVPGSSQLGSLDNQGYAGPGMGARQYDFTLWALDTEKLPVTARMTTVQIHELLETHEVAKTPPILVRNTRNL